MDGRCSKRKSCLAASPRQSSAGLSFTASQSYRIDHAVAGEGCAIRNATHGAISSSAAAPSFRLISRERRCSSRYNLKLIRARVLWSHH